ncbi:DUF58 domain-containing protein [Haladaptatus salinisoli]|uniref:DUF58 domain-containing protein n=1 Tax=Haladaptatus salinisoli TaxID=2884876 RepID=UPI001D09DE58|nr:DUF58 domain-containing protein [Haladaptatus salinisoli]
MDVTRRYWGGCGLVCLLAGGAWILNNSLLLIGAAGVGSALISSQLLFLWTVVRITDDLDISQTPTQAQVAVNSNVQLTIQGTLSAPTPVDIQIAVQPPRTATGIAEDETIDILNGEREAKTTVTAHCPIAERLLFRPPTVTFTDRAGFFRSSFTHGETATITVTPDPLGDIYVDAGEKNQITSLGEYQQGEHGTGLDPAEVRQYIPGDTIQKIDWKVTARLQEPHVREFEAETDLQSYIFLDQRKSMFTGSATATKFDYARQIVLAYLADAHSRGEPLGLSLIKEEQITNFSPGATQEHYSRLRTHLYDRTQPESATRYSKVFEQPVKQFTTSDQKATRLQSESSQFAQKLFPLLTTQGARIRHVTDDPLYRTVRSQLKATYGITRTVLITDDVDRVEVYEAVKLARQLSDSVSVFLIPNILFEEKGIVEAEDAYQRYIDFDQFRQSLTQLDGVIAFEVGSTDTANHLRTTSATSHGQRSPTPPEQ